jgi:hypothetical protein
MPFGSSSLLVIQVHGSTIAPSEERRADWKIPHSIGFSGGVCHRSLKASGREDWEIEQLVSCRDFASFDFHTTLTGMLGATLVGDQVVQVCQPSQKRLLAPVGMMERFHHKEFPVDGVMGLIQQRAGHGIRGSSSTVYQPAFFSWNHCRTRSPLATPAL